MRGRRKRRRKSTSLNLGINLLDELDELKEEKGADSRSDIANRLLKDAVREEKRRS